MNTEVKRTFCTVKIVHAYVRILVAQIRKLTVSLKNGSDKVGLSTRASKIVYSMFRATGAWGGSKPKSRKKWRRGYLLE